jgi:hypothetical protein
MKEYISEQKIIDMCCGYEYSILLTQIGKEVRQNVIGFRVTGTRDIL